MDRKFLTVANFILVAARTRTSRKKSPFSLKTSHPAKITIATCNTCKLPNFNKTNAYIFAFTTIYPSSTCTPSHHHHHAHHPIIIISYATAYAHIVGSATAYVHSYSHIAGSKSTCKEASNAYHAFYHIVITHKPLYSTFSQYKIILLKACSQGTFSKTSWIESFIFPKTSLKCKSTHRY